MRTELLGNVMVNEHNHVADVLLFESRDCNGQWENSSSYEESRRIIIAQVQLITYNGFLSLLPGEELAEQPKLRPLLSCYDRSYNKETDARVSNEFSTAAYRSGHSTLQMLSRKGAKTSIQP
ncbi:chorion peroxidase-like [Daphnia carinata]|uniref:chorion peroxidase-like n=1 Tax=Daphnia carinata TaxID=120202 RepID=UPI00257CB105|nr:chorion peroxidase-like [Daphnia carinata]